VAPGDARWKVGLLAVLTLTMCGSGSVPHRVVPSFHDPAPSRLPLRQIEAAEAGSKIDLPPAAQPPEAAPPSVADVGPLRPHEIFGFAPYWTLDMAGGFDVRSLSTVAYFGLDVNADGSLVQSGNGWTGYQSQQLTDLINSAHAARDRVVLTAKTFDPVALHHLSTDPGVATRLADQLAAAAEAKRMDGVNLDFEGSGSADRGGFTRFVRAVADRVHAVHPHWQVSVDTYAGSAGTSDGWFDIGGMAGAVDAFFVMGYDMYRDGHASANAPLSGQSPNYQEALAAYVATVPSAKVILGSPYYGYDWPTNDNAPGAAAKGAPTPLSYSQVMVAGHPVYWDAEDQVPWTAYQDKGQWHETYYDDPTSLALKAQLANRLRLLGVGIWALGMDGNSAQMMAAMLGRAKPLKGEIAGPAGPKPGGNAAPGSAGAAAPTGPSPASSPPTSTAPSPSPSGGAAAPSPSPSAPISLPAPPGASPATGPSPSPSPTPCLIVCL
jgi:hypothetical protein